MHGKGLMHDIEVSPLIPITTCAPSPDHHSVPKLRDTVSIYFNVTGPKLYVVTAWKTRPGQCMARVGLGVYIAISDAQGSTSAVSSAIQAEAQALPLAAKVASSLIMIGHVFLMDCSNLARATAAPRENDQAMLWEIRRHAIKF
jgi:hypothetical protein